MLHTYDLDIRSFCPTDGARNMTRGICMSLCSRAETGSKNDSAPSDHRSFLTVILVRHGRRHCSPPRRQKAPPRSCPTPRWQGEPAARPPVIHNNQSRRFTNKLSRQYIPFGCSQGKCLAGHIHLYFGRRSRLRTRRTRAVTRSHHRRFSVINLAMHFFG